MFEVKMSLQKETKGTVVYQAAPSHQITSLYIAKSALPTPYPDTITVKVTAGG